SPAPARRGGPCPRTCAAASGRGTRKPRSPAAPRRRTPATGARAGTPSVRSCLVGQIRDADRLPQEGTCGQEMLQMIPVRLAGEPRLAPLGIMQLRVVPTQCPQRFLAAPLGAAHQVRQRSALLSLDGSSCCSVVGSPAGSMYSASARRE